MNDTERQKFYRNVILDDETIKEIEQVIDADKRKTYREWGLENSNGLLLYGPPGTGKTTLAKQIAKLNGYGFLHESGSRFVEKYVGVGPKRVEELFYEAKKMSKEKRKPVIVFIDEIDSIGSKRSAEINKEITNTLNQLFIELDGFDSNSNIITIAATNRLDMLDEALIRPGRFDKKVKVGLPKQREREALFKLFGSKIKKKSKLPYRKFAEISKGLSGADIELVIKEATMRAIDNNKDKLTPHDVYAIIEKKLGKKKKTDNKRIGYKVESVLVENNVI